MMDRGKWIETTPARKVDQWWIDAMMAGSGARVGCLSDRWWMIPDDDAER